MLAREQRGLLGERRGLRLVEQVAEDHEQRAARHARAHELGEPAEVDVGGARPRRRRAPRGCGGTARARAAAARTCCTSLGEHDQPDLVAAAQRHVARRSSAALIAWSSLVSCSSAARHHAAGVERDSTVWLCSWPCTRVTGRRRLAVAFQSRSRNESPAHVLAQLLELAAAAGPPHAAHADAVQRAEPRRELVALGRRAGSDRRGSVLRGGDARDHARRARAGPRCRRCSVAEGEAAAPRRASRDTELGARVRRELGARARRRRRRTTRATSSRNVHAQPLRATGCAAAIAHVVRHAEQEARVELARRLGQRRARARAPRSTRRRAAARCSTQRRARCPVAPSATPAATAARTARGGGPRDVARRGARLRRVTAGPATVGRDAVDHLLRRAARRARPRARG